MTQAIKRERASSTALLAGTLLVSALLVVTTGCQRQEGPAERAGKEVDQAAEKVGQQIEKAGDKIQDAANSDKK